MDLLLLLDTRFSIRNPKLLLHLQTYAMFLSDTGSINAGTV